MVDHDIARAGIKGHHLASVFIGELEVSDAAYIKGHGRAVVAKCDEVEVLHQWRSRASEGMVERSELRDGVDVGQSRNDTRLGDEEAARIPAFHPLVDEAYAAAENKVFLLLPIRWLLINGLPVVANDINVSRGDASLGQQRVGGFRVESTGGVVKASHVE